MRIADEKEWAESIVGHPPQTSTDTMFEVHLSDPSRSDLIPDALRVEWGNAKLLPRLETGCLTVLFSGGLANKVRIWLC
jgi:hypothetical protein